MTAADAGLRARRGVPMRILITGSRAWTDRHTVEVAIRDAITKARADIAQVVVVHGGANGADACADVSARAMGLRVEEHRAQWSAACRPECEPWHRRVRALETYCPAAGNYRNQVMVDAGADVCLAFPMSGSRGTWDCVRRAEAAGIAVRVVKPGGTP